MYPQRPKAASGKAIMPQRTWFFNPANSQSHALISYVESIRLDFGQVLCRVFQVAMQCLLVKWCGGGFELPTTDWQKSSKINKPTSFLITMSPPVPGFLARLEYVLM